MLKLHMDSACVLVDSLPVNYIQRSPNARNLTWILKPVYMSMCLIPYNRVTFLDNKAEDLIFAFYLALTQSWT